MRHTFIFTLIFIISFQFLFANDESIIIQANEINKDCKVLSSDYFKGRDTPSRELDSAARYIAERFKDIGLQAYKENYFQNVEFFKADLSLNSNLSLNLKNGIRTFKLKNDFVPLEETGECDLKNAKIVFAGYGLQNEENNIDDYKGLDVKGKIVVVFRGAPKYLENAKINFFSINNDKVLLAKKLGAKAVLTIEPPIDKIKVRPNGFPWPSIYKNMPKEALPLMFNKKFEQFSSVSIGESVANELFTSIDSLKKIQFEIDSLRRFKSFELSGIFCDLKIELSKNPILAKNIIGKIAGKSDEFVVVGAHYDHIGYKHNAQLDDDSIFNGANDNASGTSAIIGIAKRLKELNNLERSIVFVAFCGEERGLLGSQAFVESSGFDMSKCQAFFNLDMLGGNSPDTATFYGDSYFPELFKIINEENAKLEKPFFIEKSDESMFIRGDQLSFQDFEIPSLMFCTGEDSRYHTVYDEYEYLDFKKAARLATICVNAVKRVAENNNYKKEIKLK